jgi:hypothetical protein
MNKVLFVLHFLATCMFSMAGDQAIPQPDVAFFTKLRMDYSHRKDFNPVWKLEDDRKAVITAYQAKDHKKAFELSERWLAKCPVDADIHTLRSAAATALGDIKSYVHHLYFAYGLMQSVMQSGDGLTTKTAFKVISVAEEYSVLREFGAEVTRQTLTENVIDKMECKFPDGQTVTLYFDASIPINAFKAELK